MRLSYPANEHEIFRKARKALKQTLEQNSISKHLSEPMLSHINLSETKK